MYKNYEFMLDNRLFYFFLVIKRFFVKLHFWSRSKYSCATDVPVLIKDIQKNFKKLNFDLKI
ncbi:hypothetical protein BpHYR1_033099 [Brachionus plicatilis]|uniref:Uncharacterized protein n=1 Tax=Brachionus plicatilis TaxID=10195 RepID=A0A3M7PZZ5_BRAPC|nr:hypothetical protein BpHYR1_033099 [Brachionus plicatilis]